MSKQVAKSELQKLKSLTDSTEVWSRRVQKFWKSTTDVCLVASKAFNGDSALLQTPLKDATESVCQCVEKVKDLAQNRYIEISRSYQEKAKSKNKDVCCKDLGRGVEDASVEISAAIFSTFQSQAENLDLLLQAVVSFQRQQLEEKASVMASSDSTSTGISRDSLDLKKREACSDENNVELDWDAFDRDLAAVASVVDRMGQPSSSDTSSVEQIQKLKKQLKSAQRENGDLMKRAILAEHALGSSEKQNAELLERLDTGFNHDDFLAVRRALKQEQIARLDAEQKLRDAHEEIKAAQFAYKVAKTVANRIADSAEIAQGTRGIVRTQSEMLPPERPRSVPQSTSVIIRNTTSTSGDDSEQNRVPPVARTDSAFFGERREENRESTENSNPFCDAPSPFVEERPPPPPETLDIIDEPEESNPFVTAQFSEKTESTVKPAENPFLEIVSNPFVDDADHHCLHFIKDEEPIQEHASNPFMAPLPSEPAAADATRSPLPEWNPFEETNPFFS